MGGDEVENLRREPAGFSHGFKFFRAVKLYADGFRLHYLLGFAHGLVISLVVSVYRIAGRIRQTFKWK